MNRLLAATLAILIASAVEGKARKAESGLFEADATLEIALEAPWRSLLRKRAERPTAAGSLVYRDPHETRIELDAEIVVRGKWRLENCSSPPLTLRFEPEQIAATAFDGQAVVHASTPCRSGERYEQFLFHEYLIYRIYGALTEVSLRVRPVVIEYRDTEGRKPRKSPAFLVEDIGLAAERLGRRWVETSSVQAEALEPEAAALFSLFQFMIGHTDWSVLRVVEGERCCHNAALLKPLGSDTGFLALPFDFDASGFVNTGEIPPSEILPIRSVRERLYRGLCMHNPQLEPAIELMNRSRREIERLIGAGGLLTPKSQRSTLRYIEEFYEIINDPEKREKRILSPCRK